MWSHRNTNDNIPPYYGRSTDGGQNWDFQFWPVTNQARTTWDARYPYVRNSYVDPNNLFRAVVVMRENSTSWDTIVYAYTRPADPTTWEGRSTPNDFRQTGEFGARVDRSTAINGGYVAYRRFNEKSVYIDGWNFTGIEGEETPRSVDGSRVATLLGRNPAVNLSLARTGSVRVLLHDGTGRLVSEVFQGTLAAGDHRLPIDAGVLSEGIYFLHVELDGGVETAKLVSLK